MLFSAFADGRLTHSLKGFGHLHDLDDLCQKDFCDVSVALKFFLEKHLNLNFRARGRNAEGAGWSRSTPMDQGQAGGAVGSSCQPRDAGGRRRGEEGKTKFIVP